MKPDQYVVILGNAFWLSGDTVLSCPLLLGGVPEFENPSEVENEDDANRIRRALSVLEKDFFIRVAACSLRRYNSDGTSTVNLSISWKAHASEHEIMGQAAEFALKTNKGAIELITTTVIK